MMVVLKKDCEEGKIAEVSPIALAKHVEQLMGQPVPVATAVGRRIGKKG